ncbi:sugar transporter, partial [Podospora didyma]
GFGGLLREPYILGLACFASIGGFLFGYDLGVIAGVITMPSFARDFPSLASDPTLQGWMVSTLALSAAVGSLANGPLADHLSRRWSLLLGAIVSTVGAVVQTAAVNMAMIFAGRAIAGLSIGMLSMVIPLYLSELAPAHLRGSLVTMQQVGATAGIMASFWIDYAAMNIRGSGDGQSSLAWRVPLALRCGASLVLGLGAFWLPYSPRWLMLTDREHGAAASLSRVRRMSVYDWRIQREVAEIRASLKLDGDRLAARFPGVTSKPRLFVAQYAELVRERQFRGRLFIACFLQVLQQLTGINAVIFYAPSIFKATGLSGNSISLLATGVVGVVNFLATIPTMLFLDRWGRRPVLIAGASGMSVSHLVMGTLYAVYQHSWAEHAAAGWAMATFVWIYVACFAFSAGCVGWVIPSEIFPPAVRSKAVSLAIATSWFFSFVIALVTPVMLDSLRYGAFYFFSAFCIVLLVWVYFFVPETQGVRMEEMDRLFRGSREQPQCTHLTVGTGTA